MATSYTATWRLAVLQPGDPGTRNSWGAIQDQTMSLMEQGSVSQIGVSINALTTYALTALNNASDQARYFSQNYTGALAGTCTVTMPDVNKAGWAQNSTTGGHDVILTAGAGTTAIVPPDGRWYFYWCDGSGNVSFPNVGFGTLSVANGLTVAAGGITVGGGGITVTGDSAITGDLTLPAGNIRLANASALTAADTGATYRNLVSLDNSNRVNNFVAGAVSWRIMAQNGTTQLFSMDNTGNFVTGAGQSSSPIATQQDGWAFGNDGATSAYSLTGCPLNLGTPNAQLATFYNGTVTLVGSITTNSVTTSYNTTSDYRLKVRFGPAESGDLIDAIPVHDAAFKTLPESRRPMFFAHELARVAPWAVSGEKDAVDSAGRIVPQMVDMTVFVPAMIAEIQSLRRRIDELEKRR